MKKKGLKMIINLKNDFNDFSSFKDNMKNCWLIFKKINILFNERIFILDINIELNKRRNIEGNLS